MALSTVVGIHGSALLDDACRFSFCNQLLLEFMPAWDGTQQGEMYAHPHTWTMNT